MTNVLKLDVNAGDLPPPFVVSLVGCIEQPAMRGAGPARPVLAMMPTPFPPRGCGPGSLEW